MQNWGQPNATFLSEMGRWKLELSGVGLKDEVLTMVLVYQDQRHFTIEWPFEQTIEFSLYQNEER